MLTHIELLSHTFGNIETEEALDEGGHRPHQVNYLQPTFTATNRAIFIEIPA